MGQDRNAEFKCRKCGKVVLLNHYTESHYCPNCGALLPSSPLKQWIFQFNPAVYRWFDYIEENKETEQWLTSQHAGEIREGDKVVIWASGKNAGIYALAEIITSPRRTALDTQQEKYWTDSKDINKFKENQSVRIRYSDINVNSPVLEDDCRKDPMLSDMTMLKAPQGTNFSLTRTQWNRIVRLVKQKHQQPSVRK